MFVWGAYTIVSVDLCLRLFCLFWVVFGFGWVSCLCLLLAFDDVLY